MRAIAISATLSFLFATSTSAQITGRSGGASTDRGQVVADSIASKRRSPITDSGRHKTLAAESEPWDALPALGIARLRNEREIEITEFTILYKPIRFTASSSGERRAVGARNGGLRPVTTTSKCYHALTEVTARQANGMRLDHAELRSRLKKPTVFVMSGDNRPVDLMFLSLFKEDALVLDIPEHFDTRNEWSEPVVEAADDDVSADWDEVPLPPPAAIPSSR